MTYTYSTTSKGRLNTAHPDLNRLFMEAIKHRDVTIMCGHRGEAEQNAVYDAARSNVRWPDSKHNTLPSRAVDAGPWPLDWDDRDALMEFSGFILGLAAAMQIPVRSGAFWERPWDPLHFEMVEERDTP